MKSNNLNKLITIHDDFFFFNHDLLKENTAVPSSKKLKVNEFFVLTFKK